MALQYSFSSSITLLILSVFHISHAHYSLSPPLDFLITMNGTRKGDVVKGLSNLKKYLANLGYIPTTSSHEDSFDDTLESAIKKYQEFYRLKTTGILDHETLKLLSTPRCGVPDFPTSLFVFLRSKWPRDKRNLSVGFPPNTREDAFVPVVKSLLKWSLVSPFRFHDASDFAKADVKISFERRNHGDRFPFDGPGGVLAHAYGPTNGRLHIDADESWITDTQAPAGELVFDLKSVVLHELGHILGLDHSQDPKACMYPTIQPRQVRELNVDDVQGIKSLYSTG